MAPYFPFDINSVFKHRWSRYIIFTLTTIALYIVASSIINDSIQNSLLEIGSVLLTANFIYAFFFLFRVQYKFVSLSKKNSKQFFIHVFIGLSYIVSTTGIVAVFVSFFPFDITNEVGFDQLYGNGIGMLFTGIYQARYFRKERKAI